MIVCQRASACLPVLLFQSLERDFNLKVARYTLKSTLAQRFDGLQVS